MKTTRAAERTLPKTERAQVAAKAAKAPASPFTAEQQAYLKANGADPVTGEHPVHGWAFKNRVNGYGTAAITPAERAAERMTKLVEDTTALATGVARDPIGAAYNATSNAAAAMQFFGGIAFGWAAPFSTVPRLVG